MKQPNWSKLSDKLTTLHDKPWQFGLFRAINLLEHEWAIQGELETGLSQRVLITPNKELGFPAADLKRSRLIAQKRGLFHIETNYSGLYGADSAMPHYVLEQTAADDISGERTRAFLDIFNHQYYCLLYQTWKKSQLNTAGVGAKQFDELLDAVLSSHQSRDVNAGVAGLKTTSATGIANLLNEEFGLEQIHVDDSCAHWQALGSHSSLGANSVLGESLILGEQVLVSGGKVIISFGDLAANDAQCFFPGEKKGQRLLKLLENQLPADLPWACRFNVHYQQKPIQTLGTNAIKLGFDSYIGSVFEKQIVQEFKDSQYKKRAALAKCA
ncbi:type VI secretion system baseplate subunit TssG [Litorilituus sediminis]|uniref:Type VI secretion system baseplate subunit TssG n=1 Tax=Litorilituus sediminis TaxID=718192 RepID=A0A4P6P4B3_9GAMM|nr:type VI secretion system baseplate subunit TssG [Litorilituus sediminis]QBG34909.1 type VI secretion system baseplate subunit TssG [Litorilituus sediminis]